VKQFTYSRTRTYVSPMAGWKERTAKLPHPHPQQMSVLDLDPPARGESWRVGRARVAAGDFPQQRVFNSLAPV
jgi:hypothetical protein